MVHYGFILRSPWSIASVRVAALVGKTLNLLICQFWLVVAHFLSISRHQPQAPSPEVQQALKLLSNLQTQVPHGATGSLLAGLSGLDQWIDWFNGKSGGNSVLHPQTPGFPADFSFNQFSEIPND